MHTPQLLAAQITNSSREQCETIASKMSKHMLEVEDFSDLVTFADRFNLFLKPISRITFTAKLPPSLKYFSNWGIMEEIKAMLDKIGVAAVNLRVVQSNLNNITLEADFVNRSIPPLVITSLNQSYVKIASCTEAIILRCQHAKITHPQPHDWERYYRDAPGIDQTRLGCRPDTVYVSGLPASWFADERIVVGDAYDKFVPSFEIVQFIFERFGKVRVMEVPLLFELELFPERKSLLGPDTVFNVYVQYFEYTSFCRCLERMYGMMQLKKYSEKVGMAAEIVVDFDRSEYLGEKAIRKRAMDRAEIRRLQAEKALVDKEKRREKHVKKKQEAEKMAEETKVKEERRHRHEQKMRELIEERRKRMQQERQTASRFQDAFDIVFEERKLLEAQRRLESIRLLSSLMEAIAEEVKFQKDHEQQEQARVQKQQEQDAVLEKERQKALKHEEKLKAQITKRVKAASKAKSKASKAATKVMELIEQQQQHEDE